MILEVLKSNSKSSIVSRFCLRCLKSLEHWDLSSKDLVW